MLVRGSRASARSAPADWPFTEAPVELWPRESDMHRDLDFSEVATKEWGYHHLATQMTIERAIPVDTIMTATANLFPARSAPSLLIAPFISRRVLGVWLFMFLRVADTCASSDRFKANGALP